MSSTGLFSISEFAKFSLTTRDTLLHYDRIGLLSPAVRGENNYRYYTAGQLSVVTVIRTMQQLGMSLEEIHELKDRRTPELAEEEFKRQIVKIDERIDVWVRARKQVLTLQKTLESVKNIDESEITVQFLPAEEIILGDLNDYSRGRTTLDTVFSFYSNIGQRYPIQELNFFIGATFSEARIKNRDWVGADRFYLYSSKGHDRRPAALYAIGFMRCGYNDGGELFERIIDHIDKNGYEICGETYEEYPLNEVFILDPDDYLKRVMITVREKKE